MAQHNAGDTAEQMPATVREWTDILARIRFGTVRISGKNITGARIKLIAYRLANFADGNGTRVRPGVARIAVDLETDYRTARLAITYLRRLGLLKLVRPGGRRGADEYRLTLPVDLLDRDDLTVWSPTVHRAEVERLSGAHRRLGDGPDRGPGGGESLGPEGTENDAGSLGPQGLQGPVDNPGSLGPEGTVEALPAEPITRPTGTPKSAITRPTGTRSLGPVGPATHQDLDTRSTHHPDQDLRTAVTLTRDTGPATKIDSPPRPERCEHHLAGGLRPDGKPLCAFCRRAEAANHPSPPEGHIAPVIQIRTREAS